MYKVMLFAGTSEGRALIRRFPDQTIQFHVFVATQYGGELLGEQDNVIVHTGELGPDEMAAIMQEGFDLVLDATHPYAVAVSHNIQAACAHQGLPYMRIVREPAARAEDACEAAYSGEEEIIWVPDMAAAAEYLAGTNGNALLTTGSKELEAFTTITDYQTRLTARVLPVEDSVMKCLKLGFKGRNLICMQGPFSAAMNCAMLQQTNARWLVTKESGNPGGFREKLAGAKAAGAGVIVVGRPVTERGLSFEQAVAFIADMIADKPAKQESRRHLALIGVGPGPEQYLSQEAAERIRAADLVIGAGRMVRAVDTAGKQTFCAWDPAVIRDYLAAHPESGKPVILLSGDTGFYSGARRMMQELKEYELEVIPGISSLSYLAARLGRSWDQIKTVSIHGRQQEVVSLLRHHREVFVLLENGRQIGGLCQELITYGYQNIIVRIGEDLGMETERITGGRPEELLDYEAGDLSVLFLEQPDYHRPVITPGLPDEAFARAKVPMTKQEIRCISLAALALKQDTILFDIGAGTGSVSIEAARLACAGQVYAIEKKAEALQLIEKNTRKLQAPNVYIVPGTAPEVLEELPDPDRIFIGGSGGEYEADT